MTVAFLTHPLGERDAGWGSAHGDNLAAAMEWLRFLKQVTGWAICYPAMAYAAAGMDDEFFRRSMLTDVIEIMERCDVVVMVGGRISPHMRIEASHARQRKTPILVLNLLDLGLLPPWHRKDEIGIEIRRRAEALGL